LISKPATAGALSQRFDQCDQLARRLAADRSRSRSPERPQLRQLLAQVALEPTFSSPIELSIADGVSAIRTGALPGAGRA
jgi:hypothetical protein